MTFFRQSFPLYQGHYHRYHIKPIVMIYLIAYTTILSVKSEVYSLNLLFSHTLLHCIFCNYYQLIKVDILVVSLKM